MCQCYSDIPDIVQLTPYVENASLSFASSTVLSAYNDGDYMMLIITLICVIRVVANDCINTASHRSYEV